MVRTIYSLLKKMSLAMKGMIGTGLILLVIELLTVILSLEIQCLVI